MDEQTRVELLMKYLQQIATIKEYTMSESLEASIKKATDEIEKILIK